MLLELFVDSPWKCVPKAYAFLPVALFKDGLTKFDEAKVFEIYTWQGKNNKQIKPFSWALRFASAPKLQDGKFYFDKPFKLVFSTPNIDFLQLLSKAFLKVKTFTYAEIPYEIVGISTKEHKKITTNKAIFRTLSPILIRDKEGNPLTPDHPEFEKELNYIQGLIFKTWQGRDLKQPLSFETIDLRKKLVPIIEENGKKIFVEAYQGKFALQGDNEDLNLVQQYGIGFRRSQGFGCIEVVEG